MIVGYFLGKIQILEFHQLTVKSSKKRNEGNRPSLGEDGSIMKGVDKGSWWIGKVERIRKKVNNKWGISKSPIDLHNRPIKSDGSLQINLAY